MSDPIDPVPEDRGKRRRAGAEPALALTGFSAVVGQIVLLREFIVAFNGNEISVGIMLATWLFWTAAGSALASLWRVGERKTRFAAVGLFCMLAASLPVTIWALRISRSWFQSVPGELISPASVARTLPVCLCPYCVCAGALFVVAARMYGQERSVSSPVAASWAYLFEALGSCIGGIVASTLLLRVLEPFQIAVIVALLNIYMATVLLTRPGRAQQALIAGMTLACALPLLSRVAPAAERAAQARLWRGSRLLSSRESIFGNLVVTENGNIRSIFTDGVLLASVPNQSEAEEGIHYALLEHPSPRAILLIGGGINGSIAEALKHPSVQRIDYVELDPALIGLARQFTPAQSAALFADPRVHLHFADGRSYLRGSNDRFDAILVNVSDPQTAQINRFYTVEFFRTARSHLAPGGLLAIELRSSEESLSPDLKDFLRCIERTLEEVFPHIAVIPGGTIHFFASSNAGSITEDPRKLIDRLHDRNLQTQYVREFFIPFRMMPDRMDQAHEQLRPIATTPVNRDFSPIAYYLNIVLWESQFNPGDTRWLRAAAHLDPSHAMAWWLAAVCLIAMGLSVLPPRRYRASAAAASTIAATGFTMMALQVFLLLAFQAIYGYVYHQLAILIGVGMAGIALGSWLYLRRERSALSLCGRMLRVQLLLAVAGPLLIGAVALLARITSPAGTWIAAQCVFPALAALAGALGGYQFPLATAIFLAESKGRRSLGALYTLDLLGGCAGALLLTTYLIPVLGFWRTAWLTAAINVPPALLAVRAGRTERQMPRSV